MKQRKTCKTCVHWLRTGHKRIEEHDHLGGVYSRPGVQFAGKCGGVESPKWSWETCEADTCDKYGSNDKQSEMELK